MLFLFYILKLYNIDLKQVSYCNAGAISCCCKGYRKTALGYKWIFLDE